MVHYYTSKEIKAPNNELMTMFFSLSFMRHVFVRKTKHHSSQLGYTSADIQTSMLPTHNLSYSVSPMQARPGASGQTNGWSLGC
jgi:hypothetical protein